MVSGMTKTAIVGSVGIVVVVLSATLGWILVPNLVSSGAVISSENSAIFEAWTVPPVPVYLQFFLFNCTNCNDRNVKNNSAVFNLQQLGPFTYKEDRIKYGSNPDGSVVEKDGNLIFRENITYKYAEIRTEDPLDAIVVTVNPIYFTLASLIADYAPPDLVESLSSITNALLGTVGEKPFMTHTVGELLFDGWSLEPYVNLLRKLNDAAGNPITIPDDLDPYFGLYYGRNGTNLGEFKIDSGAISLDQLGMIREWEGKTKLDYWNDDYCDQINGTDGAIYPPLIDVDQPQYIFTPDLCRAIYATYETDFETMGIVAKRFTVPEIVFGSPATTPENRCFCRETEENTKNCFSDGILDMRPCSFQAPILLSTPHFYMGDRKYVDAFTGLEPVKEWHETHFDLEPLTGVPTFASKRIQINIDVRKYGLPSTAVNLKNTVFPLLWINETAKLDEKSADDLNKALNLVNGLNISRWTFLAAGIVVVIAAIVMLVIFFPR